MVFRQEGGFGGVRGAHHDRSEEKGGCGRQETGGCEAGKAAVLDSREVLDFMIE